MGELFFTHSSTILTTARRILGSGDFSISDVRMTWMKFFLISILMTDSRVFTRSRLSITSSLVTARKEVYHQEEDWDKRRYDKTVSENLDEKFRLLDLRDVNNL